MFETSQEKDIITSNNNDIGYYYHGNYSPSYDPYMNYEQFIQLEGGKVYWDWKHPKRGYWETGTSKYGIDTVTDYGDDGYIKSHTIFINHKNSDKKYIYKIIVFKKPIDEYKKGRTDSINNLRNTAVIFQYTNEYGEKILEDNQCIGTTYFDNGKIHSQLVYKYSTGTINGIINSTIHKYISCNKSDGTPTLSSGNGYYYGYIGDEKYRVNVKNGIAVGEGILFHKNGKIRMKLTYDNNGLISTINEVFDKKGRKLKKGTLVHGNGSINVYFKRKKVKSIIYKNGKPEGIGIFFYLLSLETKKKKKKRNFWKSAGNILDSF